jgi:hypothetical protein
LSDQFADFPAQLRQFLGRTGLFTARSHGSLEAQK